MRKLCFLFILLIGAYLFGKYDPHFTSVNMGSGTGMFTALRDFLEHCIYGIGNFVGEFFKK